MILTGKTDVGGMILTGKTDVGGMILTGQTEVRKQNPAPVSLCAPNISHGRVRDQTQTPSPED